MARNYDQEAKQLSLGVAATPAIRHDMGGAYMLEQSARCIACSKLTSVRVGVDSTGRPTSYRTADPRGVCGLRARCEVNPEDHGFATASRGVACWECFYESGADGYNRVVQRAARALKWVTAPCASEQAKQAPALPANRRTFIEVPNEELCVGDVVDVLGSKVITAIRPYVGPLAEILFAVADTEPGCGFSLERGGYTRALRPEPTHPTPSKQSTPPRTYLSEDVVRVLSTCKIDGSAVHLTSGQLERALYLRVNETLVALGGKWNRKAKAHVFVDDPTETLDAAIACGFVVRPQDIGWFPTPSRLARELVAMADVRPGMDALEPSAGEGAIARALRDVGATVACAEIDGARAQKLARERFEVFTGDFLVLTPSGRRFDRVVMNPPFGRRADVSHVRHALSFLKPQGRLVSVMSAGVMFREDGLAREFRALVSASRGSIEPLPEHSFRESSTDVRTVVVTMEAA